MGLGELFDHVNQTGTRTQVKGEPTNKKQCKSDQNGTGMQHDAWSEREESTTKIAKLSTLYPAVQGEKLGE